VAGEVFVDTGVWYAAANPAVAEHEASSGALRRAIAERAAIVSTNLVVAETHALLLTRVNRAVALAFVRAVTRPPNRIVHSSPEIEARAVTDWLERYDDQGFSFCDAVSFAVMRERKIGDALSLDRYFRTAGFRVRPT